MCIGCNERLWHKWVPYEQLFSTQALIPVLSIICILGVITDRFADALFEHWWIKNLRERTLFNLERYYEISTRSERVSELLRYSRSRLRICRGWTFNSFLIVIFLNVFVWTEIPARFLRLKMSIFGTAAFFLLAFGSWYAYRKLALAEYRKIKSQAELLGERD